MPDFDPTKYGPAFADAITAAGPMPLDRGTPHSSDRPLLSQLTPKQAFANASVVDDEMARCCLAGVWLLHNFLDESHTISQGISTPSGSYWHGIMHRREGDFSNAKYWMRRVGEHPVFAQLAPDWDPCRFVDECEQAVRKGQSAGDAHLVAQQHLEWQLLFDFCYQRAVGA